MRVYIVSEGRAEDDDVLDVVPESEMEAYVEAKSKELEAQLDRHMTQWKSPNKVVKVVSPIERFHQSWEGLDMSGKVEQGVIGVKATVITDGNPKPNIWERRVEYIMRELWSKPKDAHPITFRSGDKVVYRPEGKVYDFGYYGQTGKAIIYNEGERNMQDSFAVDPQELSLK